MESPIKSRRGVYYDLNMSPYVYQTALGDIFKFSSSKKLEIYKRELPKRVKQTTKHIMKARAFTGIDLKVDNRQIAYTLYKEVEY